MSKKNVVGIALIRELCPVCTKENDGSILINQKLTEKAAQEVEKLHESVQWSKNLCPDCQTMKDRGFILIGAVEAKTEDATNPYRSGNVQCVEHKVAEDLFKPYPPPASGIAFVDVTVAQQMGLPEVNLNA